jgi:branched-chain amino acid transport system permease protein
MEVFLQQLINGITLGSIYGLIAIGYTMVFGIIGMVNFAHGDVFMVSAFIALVAFLLLTSFLGISSIALALFLVLIVAMLFTSLVNWTIERLAYRPLRGSFRLAPLISAIGMSIFLSNFVQVTQGPRNKSIPPMVQGEFVLFTKNDYPVTLSFKQLIIWFVTAVLLACFWYLVSKTRLGRAQRACEQDQKMAALVGVDVDRTISMTFVIAAALAAVAGRRAGRHWFAAWRGRWRHTDRTHRDHVVGIFLDRLQRRCGFFCSGNHFDLLAARSVWPSGCRKGLIWGVTPRACASIQSAH